MVGLFTILEHGLVSNDLQNNFAKLPKQLNVQRHFEENDSFCECESSC